MKTHVSVIGGGMILQDQILPSLYQLQRDGEVGDLWVSAASTERLRVLANDPALQEAFPNHTFKSFPDLGTDPYKRFPKLYLDVLDQTPPDSIVVIAIPDQLHHEVLMAALERDQHILCVKPLVLNYDQAEQVADVARERGLYVGVEYHKRFDRRALEARKGYEAGRFGEFKCGEARLIEPYLYRHSNFQNWFTKENTDPFTYIGCHYVDQVYFITGLRPTAVSVEGVEGTFPNGNVGYMWASGRVTFENGALLSVATGLGYPDQGAGSNDQGICMYCEGGESGAVIRHQDQFRGVEHGYVDAGGAAAAFRYINPDYFRLVPWEREGLRPVGYGFDSVAAHVRTANRIIADTHAMDDATRLATRQSMLDDIDAKGIMATPRNSSINELVVQATRLSIANNGQRAVIEYDPVPSVRLV